MSKTRKSSENEFQPIFTKRMGSLEIAVFEWEGNEGRVNHSTKLTYSFKRKESEVWENSDYLPTSELLLAAKLFDIAHSAIVERIQERREKGIAIAK